MKTMLIATIAALSTITPSKSAASEERASQAKHMSVKKIAADVAEQHCAEDRCFTKTLQAIAWQESMFGKQLVGDKRKIVYYYQEGQKNVPVRESNVYRNGKDMYTTVHSNGEAQRRHVYIEVKTKELAHSAVGAFQIKAQTAKHVIQEMKLSQFYHLLNNESALIRNLTLDARFAAIIAANYLKLNYEYAVDRKIQNPWFYAVSKYNGGSKNYTYVNLIRDKMKRLHEV